MDLPVSSFRTALLRGIPTCRASHVVSRRMRKRRLSQSIGRAIGRFCAWLHLLVEKWVLWATAFTNLEHDVCPNRSVVATVKVDSSQFRQLQRYIWRSALALMLTCTRVVNRIVSK